MSDRSPPTNLTLAHALRLARAGFLVFPCQPGMKQPATTNGLLDATTDETMIRTWFNNDRGLNLAVACGPQPNGVNLVAIDVDPKNGGDVTWANLINGHTLPPCPVHTTPSGGLHLFFDAPSTLHNTSGRLGPGIDTRGAGGYVVAPPSKLVNRETGEMTHYVMKRADALGEMTAPPLEAWLEDLWDDQAASMARHPSQRSIIDLGDSPADLLRSRWDWGVELTRRGWSPAGRVGGDDAWSRPDKPPREGHSAVVHPGADGDPGVLVVWTTERPPGGRTNIDGSSSFSPYDFVKAYDFGGNDKATVAWIRGVPATFATAAGVATAAGGQPVATDEGTPLFPPPEFYEQREWLSACRQMAQASGISPSAMTLAYMTRWATLIPPGFSIPAINGARSSFDLIGVVAGTSGSGKSSVMRRAEEMLPILRKDLRMGLGIGSGEGVIEAFYAMANVVGDDGEKRRQRAKVIDGVHFAIDEGLILAELSGRAGTTHNTRLQTAWSGGALSTANASQESFRHIESGQYRLTAMMAIQVDLAHELMTEKAASAGFVGRLLFAWAEEPPVRPRPPEPDRFALNVPTGLRDQGRWLPRVLTYPQAVWDELIDRHDARRGTVVPVEEHHHDLMRLKVAGQLSLMDDCRMDVSMDDWSIATTWCDCSAAIRRHLYAHRRQQSSDAIRATALRQAEREIIVNDEKEKRAIAKIATRIRTKTKLAGPDGMGRSKLRSATTTGETERALFDQALDLAIANFWVRLDGSRVRSIE